MCKPSAFLSANLAFSTGEGQNLAHALWVLFWLISSFGEIGRVMPYTLALARYPPRWALTSREGSSIHGSVDAQVLGSSKLANPTPQTRHFDVGTLSNLHALAPAPTPANLAP